MKKYLLKQSVILKNVNESTCYALDCEEDDDSFYKFEHVSKFLIESLNESNHNGLSEEELIELTQKKFSEAKKQMIVNDVKDFLQSIASLLQ